MSKFLLLIAAVLLSCGQNKTTDSSDGSIAKSDSTKNEKGKKLTSDTLQWMNSFKEFRTAIYKNDRKKVKTFIDFPIHNENNEIWYLTNDKDENYLKSLTGAVKPYPESEFDKHYDQIFPPTFIKSILKIKTDSLLINQEYETIQLQEKRSYYRAIAKFDNASKTLMVIINYVSPIKVNNGEKDIQENSESSVGYEFKIVDNNAIKFIQVKLAG
jgi:hypothetical protein